MGEPATHGACSRSAEPRVRTRAAPSDVRASTTALRRRRASGRASQRGGRGASGRGRSQPAAREGEPGSENQGGRETERGRAREEEEREREREREPGRPVRESQKGRTRESERGKGGMGGPRRAAAAASYQVAHRHTIHPAAKSAHSQTQLAAAAAASNPAPLLGHEEAEARKRPPRRGPTRPELERGTKAGAPARRAPPSHGQIRARANAARRSCRRVVSGDHAGRTLAKARGKPSRR